jgi:ketosteroid isomerase-like protein
VGDRFEGDLLGVDPLGAWQGSAEAALAAVAAPGVHERTAHLSFGDVAAPEYVMQLTADHLVHGWDLARAIGADERLDAELVDDVAAWFEGWEAGYRSAGAVGARPPLPDDADAAARLLAAFGRAAGTHDTLSVVRRFNAAFNAHDVDAVMALMTDDCAFEDTSPPHGTRHEGQAAVRKAWEDLFSSSPTAHFETEEGVISGDRATYRWRYVFDGGSVRGVDVFLVRDGKVAEKLAYVKG